MLEILAPVIATEMKLNTIHVTNTLNLMIKEQCTVPFIARYRKEMTGTMDEVVIRDVKDRYDYLLDLEESKVKYLKVVKEHCDQKPELAKTYPELVKKFMACKTKQELEDLYLPFKPKRRTRAQVAKEKGLEPLADLIWSGRTKLAQPADGLAQFFTSFPDLRTAISDEEALKGASDILAERLSETAELRGAVRDYSFTNGRIVAEAADVKDLSEKDTEKRKKFENYFEYDEPIASAPPHRILAVRRGEAEKFLRVRYVIDEQGVLSIVEKFTEAQAKGISAQMTLWLQELGADTYKRLLGPSIETEIRLELKKKSEDDAIHVFAQNLQNLLLLPPIPEHIVMGVDPGLRTGSKLAVVDRTGKVLDTATIYPDYHREDNPKNLQGEAIMLALMQKHKVEYLAIGNGTGSREIFKFISSALKRVGADHIKKLFVNESGASVYSTDAIAREEFPDLDPTLRSAVSIARRLQDPLAELVKIDPKSIGVGQYQHDVSQTKLKKSLGEVVESCVNRVGVNLNTASYSLLSYVSGLSLQIAKNVVAKREQLGGFKTRSDLVKIQGFGDKSFEQAAGFLRIRGGSHILDNTAVHPERYALVEKMAEDHSLKLEELIENEANLSKIKIEKYVSETIGLPTLRDIISELAKPGRDPRDNGTHLEYEDNILELHDLKEGQVLGGTVTNVTNFGAFVDIGVHQDGLVHISELADQFVDDPRKVVQVGQKVKVRVLSVDISKKRISLSCKSGEKTHSERSSSQHQGSSSGMRSSQLGHGSERGGNDRNKGNSSSSKAGRSGPPSPPATLDDLLKKFNAPA